MATAVEWVTAAGSLVGALGAGGALLVAASAYRVQIRDRTREHASRISVSHAEVELPDGAVAPGATVRNAGDEPIYHWEVCFLDKAGRVLGRGQLAHGPTRMTAMPPERPTRLLPFAEGELVRLENYEYELELTFTDRAGRRWRRDASGALVLLSS